MEYDREDEIMTHPPVDNEGGDSKGAVTTWRPGQKLARKEISSLVRLELLVGEWKEMGPKRPGQGEFDMTR